MPNRVLRDWTASDKIDQLSPEAEVFFTRLIMKADDYGRYYGSPKMLKSSLFPLRDITEAQVTKWVKECVKVAIIELYEVDGKHYLNIPDFGQRLRIQKAKFPEPVIRQSNDGHLSDSGRPETKRNEVEIESETETHEVTLWPTFEDFWIKYDKKVDRAKCEKKWKKVAQGAREKIMFHLEYYIKATPDVKFRRDPATYLNNESWENEIVSTVTNGKFTSKTREEKLRDAAEIINAKYGTPTSNG